MSEVMYLRMAVCTKTWGGVVVTCNLCVFSVSCIIIMNSNIFGILQAAIPLWSGMELITTYQFHDHTVLYCLLFMLSNCVSCRTSAYEATHAANWYFNTKYKMTLLRWPLCVTSLCNLNCMCSVLCVYVTAYWLPCAPAMLSTNLTLYHLVHNPGAIKMFFLELRGVFCIQFMYYCPLSGTTFKLTAFGTFVYHQVTLAEKYRSCQKTCICSIAFVSYQ